MEFNTIKTAVATQFRHMAAHPLFRTGAGKDELWTTYLQAFPEGSNPIFKTRTEHDCNCCKQFIRAVGDVVALVDGKVVSIWDTTVNDPNYQVVADAMATLVKSKPIVDVFLHYERTAGTDKSLQDTLDGVRTWNHFFINIPPAYVLPGADIATKLGERRALHDVLQRSLLEITDNAVTTVLDLIAQGSLYRGDEHKFAVTEFQKLKDRARTIPTTSLISNFAWQVSATAPASVSRIRNTSIGTLLVDLSEGKDLEYAVKAFEAKVAPTNYKRPTALVTKGMIEAAKKSIADLGLGSALERRYANLSDITVNNILFAGRSAKGRLAGDVFDVMAAGVAEKPQKMDRVEEISIEDFLADIVPRVNSIELLVENRHAANFVSLVAPGDPTANPLFKWPNGFSWSYQSDFADSIKERVKQAGGNVEGELCCRLTWDYTDDLDFHMWEPDGGHIYYGNRRHKSTCGGMLDVDANGADGQRSDPCENIFYAKLATMKEGEYRLEVNNYSRRSNGVGFEVEIDVLGVVHHFSFDKVLRSSESVVVANLNYSKKTGLIVNGCLPSTQSSKTVWNVPTQTFRPVNVLMLSPNHWDGQGIGNKHYFFMLSDCLNEGQARPFFNEFLKAELDQHRKTMELVGARLKTEFVADQLSGLGFSSTQRNDVIVRVKGSFTRQLKITF